MGKAERFSNRAGALLATLGLAALLAGCSGLGIGEKEYGCKGRPEGVRCLSTRDAYQATETRDRLGPTDAQGGAPAPVEGAAQPVAAASAPAQPLPAADGPIPLRTPSRVMRIRLNYWEDEAGDLHVPGYIYTEVEPRRWQVGMPSAALAPALYPLRAAVPRRPEQRDRAERAERQPGAPENTAAAAPPPAQAGK
jgi:conjugal transfer pilus assembly protein TraV